MKQEFGYSNGGEVREGSTEMPRRRTLKNSRNKTTPDTLFSVLGLVIGVLTYVIDTRPKMELYERGFVDCLLLLVSIVALGFKFAPKKENEKNRCSPCEILRLGYEIKFQKRRRNHGKT